MVNFKPLDDRVLVRKNPIPSKTIGGIIIPDTAENKPQDGIVLAVGPGRHESGKRIPVYVSTGDKIIFGKNAGVEVELDGETLYIMYEREIIAKIT